MAVVEQEPRPRHAGASGVGRPRLYVHYGHTLDTPAWTRLHAAGRVPDAWPYGLDRLAHHGYRLVLRPAPPARGPRAGLARAVRALSGGQEGVELVRDRERRRSSDLVVCWDERAGAAAALRSSLPGEPPTASGVLWVTEPEAAGDRRRRAALAALGRAACVYVNAPAQLDALARSGIPRDRLHFLPLGVDAAFWTPGDDEPEPGLLVAAGNDRHRDHALVVEAATQLALRRQDVRLELASHHPVAVPPQLGVRREQLDHPGMRALYRRASVVVLALHPNLHLSGLTTILEAMSCARPVVATATPGMAEYVKHGETGLLVPRDPDALATAVEELLADPDRARELGLRGRALLEQRFTTAHLAAGLARIFRPLATMWAPSP